jgi:thymidylate synthase
MRIYSSMMELFSETVREVFARGQESFDPTVQGTEVSRDEYEMKELIGYAYKLTRWSDMEQAMIWWREKFKKNHVSIDAARRWSEDMFSPRNPDLWWNGLMNGYWKKFSIYGKIGKFEYTYGERLAPFIDALIWKMRSNPNGRGHLISVWYHTDILNSYRKPCTIGYQFIWREPRGFMIVYQRSCDLINFFPLDVAKAILFGEKIFKMAGLTLTNLIHFIGSLHCYKIDVPGELRW